MITVFMIDFITAIGGCLACHVPVALQLGMLHQAPSCNVLSYLVPCPVHPQASMRWSSSCRYVRATDVPPATLLYACCFFFTVPLWLTVPVCSFTSNCMEACQECR
jgi:hypothetical protein